MSTLKFLRKPLSQQECEAEVRRIVAVIAKHTKPKAIYLFGSAAQGTATDQSDLDFLIVLSKDTEFRPARKALAKVRPFSKFPVDLIWMTEEEFKRKASIGGLAQIVAEEGQLLYGECL